MILLASIKINNGHAEEFMFMYRRFRVSPAAKTDITRLSDAIDYLESIVNIGDKMRDKKNAERREYIRKHYGKRVI